MKTKHTPGPWWFAENELSMAVGAGDEELASVGTTARSGTIPAYRVSEANARLIAAAPDLLDALQLLLENSEGRGSLVSRRAARDRARAAIAKAVDPARTAGAEE